MAVYDPEQFYLPSVFDEMVRGKLEGKFGELPKEGHGAVYDLHGSRKKGKDMILFSTLESGVSGTYGANVRWGVAREVSIREGEDPDGFAASHLNERVYLFLEDRADRGEIKRLVSEDNTTVTGQENFGEEYLGMSLEDAVVAVLTNSS